MCGKAPIDQVLKLPGIVYSFLAPMSADDISDCFESEKLFSTSNAHADPCNLNLCSSKLKQFGDWNVALDLRRTCTQIWLLWRTRFLFCFCFSFFIIAALLSRLLTYCLFWYLKSIFILLISWCLLKLLDLVKSLSVVVKLAYYVIALPIKTILFN